MNAAIKTASGGGDLKNALAPSVSIDRYGLPNEPVTFRLPRTGTVDPWFGLTRTAWNELILNNRANRKKPMVNSFSLKQAGEKRGARLISFQSAKTFFEQLAKSQGRGEGT